MESIVVNKTLRVQIEVVDEAEQVIDRKVINEKGHGSKRPCFG